MKCPGPDGCHFYVNSYSIEGHFRKCHPYLVQSTPKFTVSRKIPRQEDRLLVINDHLVLMLQAGNDVQEQTFIFGVKYLRNHTDVRSFSIKILGVGLDADPYLVAETQMRDLNKYDRRFPDDDKFTVEYQFLRNKLMCKNFLFEVVLYSDQDSFSEVDHNSYAQPCINVDSGCLETFVGGHFGNHMKICPFQEIQCPQTGCPRSQILARNIRSHFERYHPREILRNPEIVFKNWDMPLNEKLYIPNDDLFLTIAFVRNRREQYVGIRACCLWDGTGAVNGELYYRFNISNYGHGTVYQSNEQKMVACGEEGEGVLIGFDTDHLERRLDGANRFVFQLELWRVRA